MADDATTPEQLSRGRIVRDEDLPNLAAQWLADGYDSPSLRDLAALTRRDKMEAGRLLPEVLVGSATRSPTSTTRSRISPGADAGTRSSGLCSSWTGPTLPTLRRSTSWRSSVTCPSCGSPGVVRS